jgi:triphosphatase
MPAVWPWGRLVAGAENHETEVKFRTDRAGLEAVLAALRLAGAGSPRTAELRSVYFDTDDLGLKRAGMVLRLRDGGDGTSTLDVKWTPDPAQGMFKRGELAVSCPGGKPDTGLFDPKTRKRLARAIGDNALTPVFETRVKRKITDVSHRDATIEVAVDDGVIVAGARELAVAEVELEIKAGNDAALYDYAIAMQRELPLVLDFTSKSERGYRLLAGEAPQPVKAVAPSYDKSASRDAVINAMLSATLAQFVGNWAPLLETDAPEAVHQLRVALRRMRSALRIVEKASPSPELAGLRDEAKRIASSFGEARACDVFLEAALAGPLQPASRPAGSEELLAVIATRRRNAYAAARAALQDAATGVFVLELQRFLAGDGRVAGEPALSARDFARHSLDALHAKVGARGRDMPDLADEERHKLRIALKNLRYAAEFFAPLFGHSKRTLKLVQHASRLQDLLGAHNDAATAATFVNELRLDEHPASLRDAAGYVLGWHGHAAIEADAHLMEAWKAYRRIKPFWR